MPDHDNRGRQRFRLDDHRIRVPRHPVTPAQLRQLVDPPLADSTQLWRDTDGGVDEQLVEDEPVTVRRGDVFYSAGPDGAHPRDLWIIIDGSKIDVEALSMTETQLRQLVDPPIPTDRALYRDIDGAPDERIDHDEVVTLRRGAEFFSVPHITAGRCSR
ncbi:MAG: multiubiquitin domain-containing protein [Ilumatobacter sp.]|uniref:multiubiquitin domain-containing protein n=1 Tax=Ilumatobacter sp. TaxID=1967498 RepID=UPI0026228285|nr:multiubiquitin domain-containing protein [Ilumatobacter sp.]MDJ0768133.1 multiubiquitin domain-containing protein [Ilumatobacter sp.]